MIILVKCSIVWYECLGLIGKNAVQLIAGNLSIECGILLFTQMFLLIPKVNDQNTLTHVNSR